MCLCMSYSDVYGALVLKLIYMYIIQCIMSMSKIYLLNMHVCTENSVNIFCALSRFIAILNTVYIFLSIKTERVYSREETAFMCNQTHMQFTPLQWWRDFILRDFVKKNENTLIFIWYTCRYTFAIASVSTIY